MWQLCFLFRENETSGKPLLKDAFQAFIFRPELLMKLIDVVTHKGSIVEPLLVVGG